MDSSLNHCHYQLKATVVSVQFCTALSTQQYRQSVTRVEGCREKATFTINFLSVSLLLPGSHTDTFPTVSQCPSDSTNVSCSPPLGPAHIKAETESEHHEMTVQQSPLLGHRQTLSSIIQHQITDNPHQLTRLLYALPTS